jgi:hypothetical protein
LENLKEKCNLGDSSVDGRIILKLILEKYDMKVLTKSKYQKMEYSGGFFGTQ